MSTTNRHPFLTFVASGVAAFVLIGGALASISAVQQSQDTSTRAYTGGPRYTMAPTQTFKPWPTMSPRPKMSPRPTPRMTPNVRSY